MAAAERVLHGVLEGAKGLIHGVTCGAGMPYRIAEIAAHYGVHYYPIVSSARAFRALWKRAYHKFGDWLGGVVYEDPWLAGGHNGLSNVEDPEHPEPPLPRVGARARLFNLTPNDRERAEGWVAQGFSDALRTPDSTLVFVTPASSVEIREDQINCMGCLSTCQFSNWAQNESGTTGKKADPR